MNKVSLFPLILGIFFLGDTDSSYAQKKALGEADAAFNKKIEAAIYPGTIDLKDFSSEHLIAAYREVNEAEKFIDAYADPGEFQVYVNNTSIDVRFLKKPPFREAYLKDLNFLPDSVQENLIVYLAVQPNHYEEKRVFLKPPQNLQGRITGKENSLSRENMNARLEREVEALLDDYPLTKKENMIKSGLLSKTTLDKMFADLEYKYPILEKKLRFIAIRRPVKTLIVRRMIKEGRSLKEVRYGLSEMLRERKIPISYPKWTTD